MNCEELTEQIADLRPQSVTLNQDTISQRTQINSDYNAALPGDTYGGTYPPVPIQWGGLHNRVVYLAVKMPPPNALIASYQAILTKLDTLSGTYDALKMTNDMLGGFLGDYVSQSCQPPL